MFPNLKYSTYHIVDYTIIDLFFELYKTKKHLNENSSTIENPYPKQNNQIQKSYPENPGLDNPQTYCPSIRNPLSSTPQPLPSVPHHQL